MTTGTIVARPPAWPHTERNRHAVANPHVCRELCLPFPWQVFLGSPSKAFVRLSRLVFDYRLVTQAKTQDYPEGEHHDPNHRYTTKQPANRQPKIQSARS